VNVIPFVYPEATVRVPRSEDTFIRTYTGRRFWPLDPRAEEIFIEDIAHHLANECRFTGATYCHYSVAEHSVRVSKLAEQLILKQNRTRGARVITSAREIALWGLLHDASEAYLKDIASPVKRAPGLGELYRAIEKQLMGEVIARFDLMPHEPAVVKEADNILFATEMRDLMDVVEGTEDQWHCAGFARLPERIYPMDAQRAEVEFLRRFEALNMARNVDRIVKGESL
jgi:uncharacterized protein